jgi:hypothetical protein
MSLLLAEGLPFRADSSSSMSKALHLKQQSLGKTTLLK